VQVAIYDFTIFIPNSKAERVFANGFRFSSTATTAMGS
jgi:hypothetical protein